METLSCPRASFYDQCLQVQPGESSNTSDEDCSCITGDPESDPLHGLTQTNR